MKIWAGFLVLALTPAALALSSCGESPVTPPVDSSVDVELDTTTEADVVLPDAADAAPSRSTLIAAATSAFIYGLTDADYVIYGDLSEGLGYWPVYAVPADGSAAPTFVRLAANTDVWFAGPFVFFVDYKTPLGNFATPGTLQSWDPKNGLRTLVTSPDVVFPFASEDGAYVGYSRAKGWLGPPGGSAIIGDLIVSKADGTDTATLLTNTIVEASFLGQAVCDSTNARFVGHDVYTPHCVGNPAAPMSEVLSFRASPGDGGTSWAQANIFTPGLLNDAGPYTPASSRVNGMWLDTTKSHVLFTLAPYAALYGGAFTGPGAFLSYKFGADAAATPISFDATYHVFEPTALMTPDGSRAIYYGSNGLVSTPPDTFTPTILDNGKDILGLERVSGDGNWITFHTRRNPLVAGFTDLMLASTVTPGPRLVLSEYPETGFADFTNDSKFLFFRGAVNPSTGTGDLMIFPLAPGAELGDLKAVDSSVWNASRAGKSSVFYLSNCSGCTTGTSVGTADLFVYQPGTGVRELVAHNADANNQRTVFVDSKKAHLVYTLHGTQTGLDGGVDAAAPELGIFSYGLE